jgi:hypothetical protein
MGDLPKEISENLYSEEAVLYCIRKKLSLEAKPKFVVITNRRVMFLDQKILGRYDINDLPYEKLEQVYFHHGFVGSEFWMKNEDGTTINLKWLDREEAQEAMNAIRDAINRVSVEQVSIRKKRKLGGREEWILDKPKETIMRSRPVMDMAESSRLKAEPKYDAMDKLKKLKELYDSGIINEEEYQEKRSKLLELI